MKSLSVCLLLVMVLQSHQLRKTDQRAGGQRIEDSGLNIHENIINGTEKSVSVIQDKMRAMSSHVTPTVTPDKTKRPKPATKRPKPATERPKPATKRPKPATKRLKPAIKRRKPATKRTVPATKRPVPATKRPTPASKRSKPATKRPKPATKRPKPATKRPKPAKKRQKSAKKRQKSAKQRLKPAKKRQKSAEQRLKPATKRPKPATKRPKPPKKRSKPAKKRLKPTTTRRKPTPPTPTRRVVYDSTIVCHLPIDPGNCDDLSLLPSPKVRYGYDTSRAGCKQFVYSGCGGNANRFTSYIQCLTTCIPPEVSYNDFLTLLQYLDRNSI